MTNTIKTSMMRFKTEDAAFEYMRSKNRASKRANRQDWTVIIADEEGLEVIAMDLSEAIEEGFCYTWSVL